ncbi:hypothetical protein ACFOOK_27990 [Micromonospora krabiensis]|uniref:Uncharacterized protein n=1 Tax=Micromonospora krabiensis TaxID=307121 RepID=A0A1C3N4T5_9ACTN|nr:hypothetical protein [Micromonospora krabiensis]SBV27589.1 hypothetical protein GA0070620_3113 [Micromonospora krabiensis]
MTQTTNDTDIDLALDDREPELVYEVNRWMWLFNGALPSLLLPTLAVMWADLTGREELIPACVAAFVALAVVAGFALAMQYRADHR